VSLPQETLCSKMESLFESVFLAAFSLKKEKNCPF
jgi:hypothetical protein